MFENQKIAFEFALEVARLYPDKAKDVNLIIADAKVIYDFLISISIVKNK